MAALNYCTVDNEIIGERVTGGGFRSDGNALKLFWGPFLREKRSSDFWKSAVELTQP